MKPTKTLKIIITAIIMGLIAALVWWCISLFIGEKTEQSSAFVGDRVHNAELTCVVAGNDSTTLLLGSKAARFSVYDIAAGNVSDFPLPEFTAGSNTYDILPTGPDSYLVAKRNAGVLHLTYATDAAGRRTIAKCARIAVPPAPIPDKHTHYSAYSMIDADSLILLGTSNGLFFINRAALASNDTILHAAFAPQLQHLAANKLQFAQESMFVINDTLLTVTDHGIYRLAVRDIHPGATKYQSVDDDMRCYDATIVGDSLAVLWSPDEQTDTRRVTMFTPSGTRGATRSVSTSVTWLGAVGDSLHCFSTEGDFGCFHAAATIGNTLYYIRGGELCSSSPDRRHHAADEQILFADNGYALSNHMGLWDLRGDKAEFLGDLKGLSGVRNISVDGTTMYLAVADGIYAVSLSKRLLAYNRSARLVERNLNKSSDRFESVYAAGDTLLIGSRNGLHAYIQSDGRTHQYELALLRQAKESPYITHIERTADGTFLLKTLNHGIWQLADFNAGEATQSAKTLTISNADDAVLPQRPNLTWRKISENAVIIVIVLLALLGLFAAGVMMVRLRANSKLASLSRQIADERKRYDEQSAHLEQTRQHLQQRNEDLQRLENEYQNALHASDSQMSISFDAICSKIDDCVSRLGEDNDFAAYLSKHLADIRQHTSDGDGTHLHEAAEIYRLIHDFCEYTIDHAYRLAAIKEIKGIWSEPMADYKQKLSNITQPKDQSLDARLDWLVAFAPVRDSLFAAVTTAANNLVDSGISENNDYVAEDIYELWNTLILPAKVTDGRLTLAREEISDSTDPFIKARTEVLTTITCYGCSSPYVNGKPVADDSLQMIRFENTSQIGTAYKFWAMQLSKDVFEFGSVGMPATIADLMWHTFIAHQTDALGIITKVSSEQTAITLPMGVRLAFYRSHKLDLPADIEDALTNRQKGRPRKNIKATS